MKKTYTEKISDAYNMLSEMKEHYNALKAGVYVLEDGLIKKHLFTVRCYHLVDSYMYTLVEVNTPHLQQAEVLKKALMVFYPNTRVEITFRPEYDSASLEI